MRYKIAAASSDGISADLAFGAAESFRIYEVADDGTPFFLEERRVADQEGRRDGCGGGDGCDGRGGCGGRRGCGGAAGDIRAEMLMDCRCVIAAKIGFRAQKLFGRRAVSCFDVSGPLDRLMEQIIRYYARTGRK